MLITFTLLATAGPVVKQDADEADLGKWQRPCMGEGRAIASLPTMRDVQGSQAR